MFQGCGKSTLAKRFARTWKCILVTRKFRNLLKSVNLNINKPLSHKQHCDFLWGNLDTKCQVLIEMAGVLK